MLRRDRLHLLLAALVRLWDNLKAQRHPEAKLRGQAASRAAAGLVAALSRALPATASWDEQALQRLVKGSEDAVFKEVGWVAENLLCHLKGVVATGQGPLGMLRIRRWAAWLSTRHGPASRPKINSHQMAP